MSKALAITDEKIINRIYLIRGKKVMLDRDLAEMYGVTTGNLNKAVKRNLKRFPDDFMFRLSKDELKDWIFQFGTSSLRSQIGTSSWGGSRYPPFAFTEQGVAMLSSVLNSDTAIEVNIQIIRIFTRIREMLLTHKDILLKVEQIERRLSKHDGEIRAIFDVLKQLLNPPPQPRKRIGYKQ